MAKIHEAMAAIMADCPAISKSQKNQQQGFMYRGVDVVMNVLQPLMIKHKVFVAPEVLDCTREERTTQRGGNLIYTTLKVRYTFYCDDGSSVSAIVQGEGMDSADKSSNKAMSVAFKYACFQVFCIPTEEMIDPDSDTPPDSKKKSTGTSQKPSPAPSKPPAQLDKVVCPQCGVQVVSTADREGKMRTPQEVLQMCGGVCIECMKKKTKA